MGKTHKSVDYDDEWGDYETPSHKGKGKNKRKEKMAREKQRRDILDGNGKTDERDKTRKKQRVHYL
jgi:hypothetical protein